MELHMRGFKMKCATTASSIQQNKWLLFAALTFVLLLLLGNYPQLLCEIIDDLLFLQLLAC